MERIRRSDPSKPGIVRRRQGRGFRWLAPDGNPVRDEATIDRIRSLAIPPAWEDVWVCRDERGHLQAVGTDAAGRRQYIYHPRWNAAQSRRKFARMEAFASTLPQVRDRVSAALDDAGSSGDASADATETRLEPTRERVLAAAVRLLDRGYFRIGSEQYAAEHGTFGLISLRRTHVQLEPPGTIVFDFPAKHQVRMLRRIEDPATFAVLQPLVRRRGGPDTLLAAREGRRWRAIVPAEVNEWLREAAGGLECSAKDFRTWHGTVLCAVALASQDATLRSAGRTPRASDAATRREIAEAIRQTAAFLGNTPAVCRSSYVDPRVLDRYRDGRTIQPAIDRLLAFDDLASAAVQQVAEAATLRLLEDRTPRTIARTAERVLDEFAA